MFVLFPRLPERKIFFAVLLATNLHSQIKLFYIKSLAESRNPLTCIKRYFSSFSIIIGMITIKENDADKGHYEIILFNTIIYTVLPLKNAMAFIIKSKFWVRCFVEGGIHLIRYTDFNVLKSHLRFVI